jgi:hypothetical protein
MQIPYGAGQKSVTVSGMSGHILEGISENRVAALLRLTDACCGGGAIACEQRFSGDEAAAT